MFFDCNCRIGRRCVGFTGEFSTVTSLIKEMGYFGIERALVYHSLAMEYDPTTGNEQLLKDIGEREELEPCWVLMPDHTEEMVSADKIVGQMLTKRIRAARMFPRKYRFSLATWNAGEILSTLNHHRIPLFIDMDQICWQEVYDICTEWAKLPLIITNANYGMDRMVYPLLRKLDNLYLEISHYPIFRGLEMICQKFGASRLLFGTRMPEFDAGSVLTMVAFASISQDEKDLISRKNLESLLEGVK